MSTVATPIPPPPPVPEPDLITLIREHPRRDDLLLKAYERTHNFNQINSLGKPLLLHLVKLNKFALVESILRKVKENHDCTLDINLADLDGVTPLLQAFYDKSLRFIQLLLEHGAELSHFNVYGESPLLYALSFSTEIQSFISVDHFFTKNPKDGSNLMHSFCKFSNRPRDAEGEKNILFFLQLTLNSHPKILEEVDSEGYTPLELMCRNQRSWLLAYFVQCPLSLECIKKKKKPDMYHLVAQLDRANFVEVFSILHNAGVPIHQDSNHESCFSAFNRGSLPNIGVVSFKGDCSICWDEEVDLFPLSDCGHAFCRRCLDVSLSQYTLEVVCPHRECKQKVSSVDLLTYITDTRIKDRVDRLLLEVTLNQLTSFVWCLKCPSGGFTEDCDEVHCNDCGFGWCNTCNIPLDQHDNVKCMENKSVDWKDKNTKNCPKCNIFIEHGEGCSHMSCKVCSHQFCWICLGDYKGVYTFDTKSASCPCPKPVPVS